MTYKLIDLFSGAGGMTLGFVDHRFCGGFESVLAVDMDRPSIETHKTNFKGKTIHGPIEEWLATNPKIPKADVVIGGPPCQGFSLLNKNRQGDARRALWEPYLDIVRQSEAKIFVMENVTELYRSPELSEIEQRAEEYGYELKARILNAADYGAAQTRKRTIVIGWKPDQVREPAFPPPTHGGPDNNAYLPTWRTVRDVIGDLNEPLGTELRNVRPPYNLHFGRTPTSVSLARYKSVPVGGNRFDLMRNAPEITPACWIRKTSGGTDLFGRLWWDKPSVTIRTEFFKPEKGRYLHPEKHRPITHREAARIMGFPDDFVFCGTKIDIAKQIGNAVPPNLASAIARIVSEALSTKTQINSSRRNKKDHEEKLGETIPA
jgi:DNA (cytosine-5)-methyltransferase 1